jgi:hypothetical protein
MAEVAHGTPCATHAERSATALCDNCGRPTCAECAIESVAAESVYCSEACRAAASGPGAAEAAEPGGVTLNAELVEGMARPIRRGWMLWLRSLGQIVPAVLPSAILCALALSSINPDPDVPFTGRELLTFWVVVPLIAGVGVSATGVILSQRLTGLVKGSPIAWAARRFVPWAVTWLLVFLITMAGTILFIIPGIYLGIRFFWADEYALVHGRNPIRALRESWYLTHDEAGNLFVFQFLLGLASYVILFAALFLLVGVITFLETLTGGVSQDITFLHWFFIVLVVLVCYGCFHGPELVKFYGLRARRARRARALADAVDWT